MEILLVFALLAFWMFFKLFKLAAKGMAVMMLVVILLLRATWFDGDYPQRERFNQREETPYFPRVVNKGYDPPPTSTVMTGAQVAAIGDMIEEQREATDGLPSSPDPR